MGEVLAIVLRMSNALSEIQIDWGMALLISLLLACLFGGYKLDNKNDYERRILMLIGATSVAIIITLFLYLTRNFESPETFRGAVFAAWYGSVIFFTALGLIVTIITLVSPEDAPFDVRARILFKGQKGPHINYIISCIKNSIEYYSDEQKMTIAVVSQCPLSGLLRIVTEEDAELKSYIDDQENEYSAQIKLIGVTINKDSRERNRLVYLRAGGVAFGSTEFDSDLIRPYTAKVAANGSCKLENKVEVWFNPKEETYLHRLVRFTKRFELTVENSLPDSRRLRLSVMQSISGNVNVSHEIPSGQSMKVISSNDVHPNELVFEIGLASA